VYIETLDYRALNQRFLTIMVTGDESATACLENCMDSTSEKITKRHERCRPYVTVLPIANSHRRRRHADTTRPSSEVEGLTPRWSV